MDAGPHGKFGRQAMAIGMSALFILMQAGLAAAGTGEGNADQDSCSARIASDLKIWEEQGVDSTTFAASLKEWGPICGDELFPYFDNLAESPYHDQQDDEPLPLDLMGSCSGKGIGTLEWAIRVGGKPATFFRSPIATGTWAVTMVGPDHGKFSDSFGDLIIPRGYSSAYVRIGGLVIPGSGSVGASGCEEYIIMDCSKSAVPLFESNLLRAPLIIDSKVDTVEGPLEILVRGSLVDPSCPG